jgi:hypothetical protein
VLLWSAEVFQEITASDIDKGDLAIALATLHISTNRSGTPPERAGPP